MLVSMAGWVLAGSSVEMSSRLLKSNPDLVTPKGYDLNLTLPEIGFFICNLGDGWYVETRLKEYGPYQNLRDAEDFCDRRFGATQGGSHE